MILTQYIKEREDEIKKVSKIRYPDDVKLDWQSDPKRIDADIDYARILYSSSFRRLQGKMQLMIPGSFDFHRNRLTHSLEVAQIAKSIAHRLGLEDTTTVQSISLAHDLGNPPFGHAGEKILSSLTDGYIYEGNAQTYRILTNLEDKFHEWNGLLLTGRTLLGVIKYPYNSKMGEKKYLYDSDYNDVLDFINKYNVTLKTIDCEIMDLSDEIAYAAHDLEDALRWKYFNIDDLIYEFKRNGSEFISCADTLQQLVDNAKSYASNAVRYETSEEFSALLIKRLTSSIVNILVQDIGLIEVKSAQQLGYLQHGCLAKGLKKLTFNAIKRDSKIIQYELLGKKVLKGLWDVYTDTDFNKDLLLLPAEYRNDGDDKRTILDYIGGMQDNYAIEQYKKYFGSSSIESLYK